MGSMNIEISLAKQIAHAALAKESHNTASLPQDVSANKDFQQAVFVNAVNNKADLMWNDVNQEIGAYGPKGVLVGAAESGKNLNATA